MATTPVPAHLANVRRPGRVRRVTRWVLDPYYFAHYSISHGPDQLPAAIPATGPGSAGATFPTLQPQIASVEVIVSGTVTPTDVYGSNMGRPAPAGVNLGGGI